MDQSILKHSASCGRFQIIQVFFIQLPRFVSIWGIFLMFFGNYNPGWRCLSVQDNNSGTSGSIRSNSIIGSSGINRTDRFLEANDIITTSPVPLTLPMLTQVDKNEYSIRRRQANFGPDFRGLDDMQTSRGKNPSFSQHGEKDIMLRRRRITTKSDDVPRINYNGTCDVTKTCRRIQFNPESSTIITEFGLVCDKDWVPSLILTIVNAGFFVGSFVSGQVSERFGRKCGLYGSTLILAISSGAAVFSPNWETYAFFTFFIGAGGFGIISSSVVFTMEFLNSSWRGLMSSRPVATLSLCVLSVVISLLKSWKYLHAVTCVASCLSLLGYFVVTESPRWLFVNAKNERAYGIVQKIAQRNRKPLPYSEKEFMELVEKLDQEKASISYSYLDIVRTKEHLITTVKFSILMIFELFIYHAFIFGVKSIPGDFYTNALVSSLIQAAVVLSAGPISNFTGRRASGFLYSILGSILCGAIVTSVFVSQGYTQAMIIKISAYLAKAVSQATIAVTLLCAAEIFPTAIRSVGVSFVNGIACVGGLIAPYVIPRNGDDVSFACCFSVMAFCFLFNGAIFYILPETKNGNLKDNLLNNNEKQSPKADVNPC